MIYGRTLYRTLTLHKQADRGKISITFEPLVRFEKFKGLNWSEFNLLLIYVIFKFNKMIYAAFRGKNEYSSDQIEKNFS